MGGRVVQSRVFIEFVVMLALERSGISKVDKKEFWMRVENFQSESAIDILAKQNSHNNLIIS